MSNRKKVQYGTPAPGSPGSGSSGGPIGTKIAIGAVVAAVVITLIVVVLTQESDTKKNTVAFQNATVTGTPLPSMPDGSAVPADDPATGQTIPTITGKSFDDSKVVIEPGEPMIIAVLAHWCPHCQKEVPLIAGWQKDGLLDKKVKFVGVSTAAEEARGNFPPASWLEAEEWKNTTLVDTPTSKVMTSLGVTGFPTLIAVTADGKVAQRASGELELSQVQQLVDAALGKEVTPTETPGTTPITSPVPTSAP